LVSLRKRALEIILLLFMSFLMKLWTLGTLKRVSPRFSESKMCAEF
jgi:hypothetical protein